jgi:ABC-2 type transport system permease protein
VLNAIAGIFRFFGAMVRRVIAILSFFRAVFKSITRILSFFSQWLAEVVRQPWLMVSLVVGPFLILLLFGEGETIGAPKPRAVLVQPAGQSAGSTFAVAPQELSQYLTVVNTTPDEQQARSELVNGNADIVVVLPSDPTQAIAQGKHAQLQVLTNEIDPVRESYADAYIQQQVAALNQRAIQKTIADTQGQIGQVHDFAAQAQQYLQIFQDAQTEINTYRGEVQQLSSQVDALDTSISRAADAIATSPLAGFAIVQQPVAQLRQIKSSLDALKGTLDQLNSQLANTTANTGGATPAQINQIRANLSQIDAAVSQFKSIPPDVLSVPFTLSLKNVAPFVPTAIGFYAPAVLALLLQHLAVTLGALSMTRVRLLGLMELFQTAPVKPGEVAVGNYLSYGVLCAVAGGLLVVLLTFGLGVPVFGSLSIFIGMLALLVLCSLGIGFVISMISSSEQQAAQIAMLVLIASVFFSGFLVSLDTIEWPVRAVSYALPATYAIRTLQDVMLRGVLRTPGDIAVLGVFSVLFFIATLLLFHREFRAR